MSLSDWRDRGGFFGAAVFVLFFQVNATVAFIALCLTILAFLWQLPRNLPALAAGPLLYLWLALLGYIAVSAALGAAEFPETAAEQWKSLKLCLESLLFIPLGFYLGRGPLGLERVFLLFTGGVLLRILSHVDTAELFSGERLGFGLNPIAMALYAGLAALTLLTLAPRLVTFQGPPAWRKPVLYLVLTAALLVFLEAMVLSQSRGAWLAAALAFPPTMLARYGQSLRTLPWRSGKTWASISLAAVLLGFFALHNAETIQQRVSTNPDAVQHAVQGEAAEDGEASIGFRLLLWRVGLEKWMERPLGGWGAGSTEYLLTQANVPMLMRGPGDSLFSHLHNTYLEILLRFGVLGLALFAALAVMLIRAPWRSYRAGLLPRDMLCLLGGLWAMTVVWAFFDFRFFHYEWRNFCVLLGALSYSQILVRRQAGRGIAPAP